MTLMACYGAPVEPYDGGSVAADCGAGGDRDGDGQCAPLDCDDSQPGIYTGAADPLGDGIDQDCDGQDG